ncbi:hypothetical protein PHLCEN_2v4255 [Hermanssonia centrifuga]|uniref:Uncharacterized protein n=1 Tax=Hermanssonia centrifuga TaxID=98765 RepID=A0A2R6PYX6_9APHY|nr:hypothetical protein PHLCEN_2v4255 [Hermanssonia centrifuga]
MIWGLEGDDVSHSRPRSDATHAPHHTTVRKATGRQQQTQAPPRFHAHKLKDEVASPSFARMPQAKEDPRENTQQMAALRLQHKENEQPEYEYSLPAHGPIDLTNIIRPRSAGITANAYVSEFDFPNNLLYGVTGQDSQPYRSSHDLDLHWQRLLLTQQGLRNSALSAPNFSPNDDLVDYLQPSLSSLSLSSLASSRSPIILDPPSQMSQYPQRIPSQNMSSPRNVSFSQSPHRMSALEIAQNYRQKQLSQEHQAKHHAMLPTPPSSSSPLWSQGFSPYQESLLSPEVLAASSLSNLTVNRVSSAQQHRQHPLLQQANSLSQIRQTGYDRLGYSNFGIGKNHVTKPLLLPNARMQGRTNYEDTPFSSNAPDLSILNKMHRPQQPKRSFLPSSPVTIISQHSPVQPPRPPPNSPLASRLKPQEPRNEGPSTVVTPLSPQSPKPRLRSISQQHPRSIPLTRLIQRRLSSVPEEDAADNDSSPPCADGPSTQRTRSHSIGSAINPLDTFSTIRMAGNTLFAPRSQDNDSVFAGMDRVAHTPETAPSVKLPGKQGKAIPVDPKVKSSKGKPEDGGSTGNTLTENAARGPKGSRGHGRGRGGGGKGRKGRPLDFAPAAVNGPERVNGGMTVRS